MPVTMLQHRNPYCDNSDEMCGEQHVCTRLADHDGDHYDAVTERRWHNTARTYGTEREQ